MNRKHTNLIRNLMDEWVPPVIRDSRWFMYPFFYYWFKGKKVSLYMDFKELFSQMTDEEFATVYRELECRGSDRPTDLNPASIDWILNTIDKSARSLLDAGSGRGYLLSQIQRNLQLELYGCDFLPECPTKDVNYRVCGIENLSFDDNSIDVVISTHTLEHVRDYRKAIEELKRVASKQVIIVVPKQRYYYYTLDCHINFFPNRQSLIDAVGLKNYQCFEIDGDWVYAGKIDG